MTLGIVECRRRFQPNLAAVRHGFTLVELLVVIAIIGTLVGLLLPAVQAADLHQQSQTGGPGHRQLRAGPQDLSVRP